MNPLLVLAIASLLQGAGRQTQPPIPAAVKVAPVPLTLPQKYSAKSVAPDTIVAKVDGQAIREKDIEGMVWEAMGTQAASEFVNLVIVRRAAVAENVTVTQTDIEKRVDQFLAASDEKTKGTPQRPPGMTVESYLALREGLPLSRIYLNSEVEVTLGKIVTKSIVAANYVKLSVIEFRPADQSAAAVTAASQKATAAAAKLKLGQKWSDVLKSSDNPPELMANDGEAGWIPLNVIPTDLQKQLAGLKAGAITQPLQIQNAFQIFKVDELGTSATPAEVEAMKSQFLQSQSGQQKIAILMNDLIKNSKVERFPVFTPGVPTPETPPKK